MFNWSVEKHLSPAVHFQAASDILTKDRSTVEKVKEILLPIEQICCITISDVEAATIISIIKGKEQWQKKKQVWLVLKL